jgi:hypothetical protein
MKKYKNNSKTYKTNKNIKKYAKGGAIYSFDLNDKIGGLPNRISLNGTQDGDCPSGNISELGFANYGLTKPMNGGKRHNKSKKHRKTKQSKSKKSKTSKKNKKY